VPALVFSKVFPYIPSMNKCKHCNKKLDRYIKIDRETLGMKFRGYKEIVAIPLCGDCWFKRMNPHIN